MKTIQVTDSVSQETIAVAEGDQIELRLEENPTTGYRWEITQINNEQLTIVNNAYTLYESAGIGGGGIRTVHIHVLRVGTGQLVLENRQSWSNDVYKSFTLSYQPE
ncbi:protease inhibitor I42 family protein [Spirosoma oryzicola]|uniref:protease inhibitor I42 family protein n=1 Tax=Spirosoma oryzicola TaxID=2898794 RepID=UPI001E4C8908|nr:protease inhibitor I42 family protein [Spirosoma oryzicola]UHG90293.1 protease inhibitor I42 family protein [Spirosoma oryzicola]